MWRLILGFAFSLYLTRDVIWRNMKCNAFEVITLVISCCIESLRTKDMLKFQLQNFLDACCGKLIRLAWNLRQHNTTKFCCWLKLKNAYVNGKLCNCVHCSVQYIKTFLFNPEVYTVCAIADCIRFIFINDGRQWVQDILCTVSVLLPHMCLALSTEYPHVVVKEILRPPLHVHGRIIFSSKVWCCRTVAGCAPLI